MKEIYRSFEGRLNVEQRWGYIVYDCGDVYEVDALYVDVNDGDWKVRIYKEDFPDLTDFQKICEIAGEIKDGLKRGAVFYRNKWYNQELINKIQDKTGNPFWKRYVSRP